MDIISLYTKANKALKTNHTAKTDANKRALRLLAIVATVAFALTPEMAMAEPWDSMGTKVLEIFTGGLTRTIAIITVIACGIAAMAGKLSWDWVIKIIVGIVLIFGGATIVDYFIAAAT